MAERTPAQAAPLARLTTDLHGTSIDATLTHTGELEEIERKLGVRQ